MRSIIFTALVSIASTGAAQAATFAGEFFNTSSGVSSLAAADAAIAGQTADATFESTVIDYPNGSLNSISDNTTLSAFLGVDAGSLVGDGSVDLTNSIFRWTGYVDLAAGSHTLTVGSDDGFRLTVGGNTILQNTPRGFAETSGTFNFAGGVTAVELLFYENSGYTGVEFSIDGALASAATPVPLPATAALSLAGLGALTAVRRARKAKA